MNILISLCLAFITIRAVKSFKVNCSTDLRISKEIEEFKSALEKNSSIYFVVDYGVPYEDEPKENDFFYGTKSFTVASSYIIPFALIFSNETNGKNITIRIISNIGTRKGAYNGYIERTFEENIFCTIFEADQKHCIENTHMEFIRTSTLVITSNQFKDDNFLMVCHISKEKEVIDVQKEFLMMINKNNQTYFDVHIYRNKISMKNLVFKAFEIQGYEICDNMKYFLNNCKVSDKINEIDANCLLYLSIFFGIYLGIFMIIELILYLHRT